MPLLPGSELLADADAAAREARRIGYPVMLKSTAGGGGIGMQLVRARVGAGGGASTTVERLSRKNFSGGGVFLENYVEQARHIEVQIFGDGEGGVVALGERDCSVQRRNQKVIEETPAPGSPRTLRAASARRPPSGLGRAVRYRSAGTVEFVYDAQHREFYFLEVNTRLQVEHGVTEAGDRRRPGRMDDPRSRPASGFELTTPVLARRLDRGAALRGGSGARISGPRPAC